MGAHWLLGHLLAIAIGISLGLLGGGGSVLALPVLVYVMGIDPKPAIAMTLVIVGSVSAIGVIPHARRGNLNLKKGVIFGSATVIGAYLGARIATLPAVTSAFQMLLFALSMLLAAGLMIYRTSRSPSEIEDFDSPLYNPPACRYCWLWLLTEGIAVGILTGLIGVGGGFAIVPALVLLGKVPMRQAIATSLFIIACNSLAGIAGYWGKVDIDWAVAISFTFLAALGSLIGSHWSHFVPVRQLQKGFGYFLLAVAAFVLFQNRGNLHPQTSSLIHQLPMEETRREV